MKLTFGLSALLLVLTGTQPLQADQAEKSVAVITEPHTVEIVRPAPPSGESQQVVEALVAYTKAAQAAERQPKSRRKQHRREDASDVFDALLTYYEIIAEEPTYPTPRQPSP